MQQNNSIAKASGLGAKKKVDGSSAFLSGWCHQGDPQQSSGSLRPWSSEMEHLLLGSPNTYFKHFPAVQLAAFLPSWCLSAC